MSAFLAEAHSRGYAGISARGHKQAFAQPNLRRALAGQPIRRPLL